MLFSVDPIGKIQQIYLEGTRHVPYMTFIHVFNELLADTVAVVPKEPCEELREMFRATCMAANVGVSDPQGRGEQRVEEFRQKVYPVWKEKLPAEEFAKFEDILQGAMREKFRGKKKEPELAVPEPSADSAELLRKLGLVGAEEREMPAPGVFGSVDELVAAVKGGGLALEYTTRQENREFARYRLNADDVTVKLARAEDKVYVVLSAGVGYAEVPEAGARITDFAADMRYVRMVGYAYMRQDEEFVYTLKVGPESVSMACALAGSGSEEAVVRQIQKLHADLGELVERIRER